MKIPPARPPKREVQGRQPPGRKEEFGKGNYEYKHPQDRISRPYRNNQTPQISSGDGLAAEF